MQIPYSDLNVARVQGDYWADGPTVKFFKDTRWVIAASGRPVLIGKRWRSTDDSYYQITSELEPGQQLIINKDGEAHVA